MNATKKYALVFLQIKDKSHYSDETSFTINSGNSLISLKARFYHEREMQHSVFVLLIFLLLSALSAKGSKKP